jgi:cellulose synthase/poly-beta-1,6-N-acetylglucosamine synthase-like glycosyltransferase
MTDYGAIDLHWRDVEVVVPVYKERPEDVQATLAALLAQTQMVSKIYVIDDCSPIPVVLPEEFQNHERVCLVRVEKNGGISAARNFGIEKCKAPFLACVNCEVLLAKDWIAACAKYLASDIQFGVAYTRMVPYRPESLLSRWRMRFQEPSFPDVSGRSPFAPGHAMMFRREAIERVGGFDVRMRCDEDSDICIRIDRAGWQTQFVADSECVSIQRDTLTQLARKELTRSDWESPEDYFIGRFILFRIKWTLVRMARNFVKLRFHFLPVDFAVFLTSIKLAISRSLQARKKKL